MPHVVVVGAGPVGLTAAALLAARGVMCTVLERHPAAYELPRAVHLDDEALRILQSLGLSEAFARVSRPMPGMRLVDAQQRLLVEFRRTEPYGLNGHPAAAMFHQPDLENLLLRRVQDEPGITVRRGCRVDSVAGKGPVVVRFAEGDEQRELTADALLGADGADSMVRAAIGSRLVDLHFEERWLVLDLRVPEPLDVWAGVHQVCDPARPATFMHVTGDRYRWEFRLRDGEDVEELTEPPAMARLLAPWIPATMIRDVEVVRRTAYTFRARVADRWRAGRVLLVGDAAHQMPPFIGQGLGAGLRDAANLAWKLAEVLHGADERLLDSYEQERRAHVTVTTRGAVAIGWALTGGQDGAASVRRALTTALSQIPGLPELAGRASAPRLRRSDALPRRHRDLLGPIGLMCPQPLVTTSGGARRLDDLLGDGWALLTRGPAPILNGPRRPDVRALDVERLTTEAGPDVAAWMRRRRTAAMLVRPDRIVAASGAGALRPTLAWW